MRLFAYLIAAVMMVLSLSHAQAQSRGSREDAIKLVNNTVQLIEKIGIDAVIDGVNKKQKRFIDRDLYVFILGLEVPGIMAAHGVNQKLVGVNTIDFQDQNGKYFVRDFYEVARSRGNGWVDYRWANAKRTKFEDKSTYLQRVGNHFVAVGIYKTGDPNRNTVGIISGNPNSAPTYLQIAYDLAATLNDGDELRVVPVVGVGGAQNIRDVRSLKGIDIGITQSNILQNYRRQNTEQIGDKEGRRLVYIAKLFEEEVHVIAKDTITSISQLRGKKVNLDEVGSGTQFTMRDVFRALGIKIEEVNLPDDLALEKVKNGEIAASVLVAGKSAPLISSIKSSDGLRLLEVPYVDALQKSYLPAKISSKDYPNLIAPDQSVSTAAVSAVLIAYNWEEGSERYRRVKKFVDALLAKIDEFHKPGHHPKWSEVNLASKLPGWERFAPMEALLAQREEFDAILRARGVSSDMSPAERERLFGKFMEWVKLGGTPPGTQ